jgi:hypothetical protein
MRAARAFDNQHGFAATNILAMDAKTGGERMGIHGATIEQLIARI